jgi:protein-disulfide isomerase
MNLITALAATVIAAMVGYRTLLGMDAGPPGGKPELHREWRGLLPITSGPRTHGAVTMIAFMDLQCPYCAKLHQLLDSLESGYPDGALAIRYAHYPLPTHPAAEHAAKAADCADRQDRFMPFVAAAFAAQDSLGVLPWTTLAARAGVPDSARFESCVGATDLPPKVRGGLAAASSLKLVGTPSLLIDGWLIPGVPTFEEMTGVVDALRSGRRPFPSRWDRWLSSLAS